MLRDAALFTMTEERHQKMTMDEELFLNYKILKIIFEFPNPQLIMLCFGYVYKSSAM